MTNVGKVQGTTVAYLGNGKQEVKFVPQGQKATFNFGSNKVQADNVYKTMGLNLSSAKAAEPQGEEDDPKVEDSDNKKADDKAAAKDGGTNVTVGNDNKGPIVIIIGNDNDVRVGATEAPDKVEKPEAPEDPEKPGEAEDPENPGEAENPAVEDPNKTIIDTLKEVIKKLLDLINYTPVEAEEVKEAEETDEADNANEGEKPEAPKAENPNKKAIDTLKEVITMLLDLIQYQETKKADEAKEDKKEEEKPEAAEE